MTPPGVRARPAGFVGRLHLTVPLITLLGLADRPGQIPGLGPVDPWLARDLARAAAANPATTWCLTVTDQQGHAIGHGCARPAPKNRARRPRKQQKTGAPGGPDPPDPPRAASRDGPGFTFTAGDRDGPPGGYGSWRLATGIPGQRDLAFALDPIATGTCDHRFEAGGHDPGRTLRHLAQIRHATCASPTCGGPPPRPTSSTTFPTRRAVGRVCATAALSADMTTGSNSTPAGKSADHPGHLPMDRPIRPEPHHRSHSLPHLMAEYVPGRREIPGRPGWDWLAVSGR